jgi:enamine deaminase RidA (YjgF/YER057c/UK114 family)
MKKEAIFPAALPKPVMGYSPVVKAGPYVFVSGQVASDVVKADIYLTDCQDFY